MYNFRKEVFSDLMAKGYRVCVCSPFDKVFSRKLQDLGCEVHSVALAAKGVNPLEDLSLTFKLLALFLKLKPDFIFCYTIKPNIYGSFAAFLANIPSIAITTGLGYSFLNKNFISWLVKILYKIALKFPKEVWFLNQDDLDTFLQQKLLIPNKAKILKSEGVNLDDFALVSGSIEKKAGQVSFLLSARLLWDKGVGEFVEAAKKIKRQYPQTRFALLGFMGSDNPSAIPEYVVKKWVAEGEVEYLGSTDNVKACMQNFDCICLPSYREGVPRSLLEGAAMGKILITTDAVGCRETVDDNITGFLCEVKDSVSLAECMKKVINMSEEERIKMGCAGRKKMQQEFDVNYILAHYSNTLTHYL